KGYSLYLLTDPANERFSVRGRLVQSRWQHDPTLYAPPRYRRGCNYKAFIPDALTELPAIAPTVAGTISAAEEAIRQLNTVAQAAGVIRNEQNWIGSNDYNPCGAAFVPPPPAHVRPLLDDLVDFCNRETLPPLAQAAFAHAQFETIHPFADGNGRIGRALVHV